MRTLFKYYSNLDRRYFTEPTIKISNVTKLNDPFEKIVPENLMACALDILSDLVQSGGGKELNREFHSAMNTVSFLNLIGMVGVVSLTETPRNLLMWSHYANNHKGICVGYRSDFLDHHKTREHPTIPTEFTPIKVNYDDSRYDKHTEKLDSSEIMQIRKEILKRSLLKKSNDWLYEKEYRSIIPLEYNDQVVCLNKAKADDYVSKFPRFQKINEKSFKQNHLVSIFSSPIYDDDDLMFTLNINPSSIEYIYFGCESDILRNIKIFNLVKKSHSLSHIKVFQMEINKNRFELDSILFDEYLDNIKKARNIKHKE